MIALTVNETGGRSLLIAEMTFSYRTLLRQNEQSELLRHHGCYECAYSCDVPGAAQAASKVAGEESSIIVSPIKSDTEIQTIACIKINGSVRA